MNIKEFNCCGSNEWLISRSEARKLVRGFRQDLNDGVVDWSTTFGFCISCGSEYTFEDACYYKGEEYAIAFYNQQLSKSNAQKWAHQLKRFGGISKLEIERFRRSEHFNSKTMVHLQTKTIEAIARMNQEGGKEE